MTETKTAEANEITTIRYNPHTGAWLDYPEFANRPTAESVMDWADLYLNASDFDGDVAVVDAPGDEPGWMITADGEDMGYRIVVEDDYEEDPDPDLEDEDEDLGF